MRKKFKTVTVLISTCKTVKGATWFAKEMRKIGMVTRRKANVVEVEL